MLRSRSAQPFPTGLAVACILLASSAALAAEVPCTGGFAGAYPCDKVDLLSHLTNATLGGGEGNDIWGWTDPSTGDEYALMGLTNGTAFVKITDPVNPVFMGRLPKHAGSSDSSWRDIKVYADHAYVVADNAGNHGMQIFDLTLLRSVSSPPVTFTETAWYGGSNLRTAHNIVIDEQSGYAYAVGVNTSSCSSGGLHMIDISVPESPVFAGCWNGDGYTHDAQCVVYTGPDAAHQGKQICFNSNEDTLTIVDVTSKPAPLQLARKSYSGYGYTHQGWLTDDQQYFLLDDELDEYSFGHNTRTRVFDVRDLDNPSLVGYYDGPTTASDHNLYVRGSYAYEADYRAGLRILDIAGVASATLTQAAFFDIYPANDDAGFSGAWSNYPYFPSGNVIVSGIEQGLFVLRPRLCNVTIAPATLPPGTVLVAYSQQLTASGGTAPYMFSVISGTLPPGLVLSAGGLLSGTPTSAATYNFTVQAQDAASCAASQSYSLVVSPPSCPTITLAPATLPSGGVGTAYGQTLTASGGTAPYTFSLTAGTLPPGLTLAGSGLLSGVPTAAGSYGFDVTATDAAGCTGSASYALVINAGGCGTIVLAPPTLPSAVVGATYAVTITASGGSAPYQFTVAAGTLPPGVTLASGGALGGTLTTAGSYGFTVAAQDGASCIGSRAYVIDVVLQSNEDADYVAGQGLGAPNGNRVRSYDQDGVAVADFAAYGAGSWGANVATGAIDTAPGGRIVTGPGPGAVFGPQARAFTAGGAPLAKVNFYAYQTLKYGLNVATGDLDRDGFAEIVTGPGPGAVFGPHLRAFNDDGSTIQAIAKISFFAYQTLKYGLNIASGDIDGDGYRELLTAPGPGAIFGPQVRAFDFDATMVSAIAKVNFSAFSVSQYGARIGTGDADGDGIDELVASPGAGPGAAFPARFRGFGYDAVAVGVLPGLDITPFPTYYGGFMALGDTDDTRRHDHITRAELVAGAGPDPGADSTVLTYTYDGTNMLPRALTILPFGTGGYGVTVAAGDLAL